MSQDSWFDANNRYLAASLEWLRRRLDEFGSEAFRRDSATESVRSPDVRPAASESLKAAAAARDDAATIEPPPALAQLALRLQLSDFERDTLLLCAAMEFDPSLAARCAAAHGNPAQSYPTFALALSVLDDPSWDALSPHRPLRHARLIEINQPGATPLTAAALRADERVVNFLKGINALDDRLTVLLRPTIKSTPLAASQRATVDTVIERLHVDAESRATSVVQLLGVDPGSRVAVAQEICAAVGRRLYRLAAESVPSAPGENESVARLWERETLLLPIALYIDADALEGAPAEAAAPLQRFLSRDVGLVFVGVRETPLRLPVNSFPIEVHRPTPSEQFEAWMAALQPHSDHVENEAIARSLAGHFHLNLRMIREAASHVGEYGSSATQLWRSCRDLTRPKLDQLAQRLQAKATWDELVLPDEQMKLMHQIAGQVRDRHRVYTEWGFRDSMNRGFGISALFAGESGTGKTMAAEVLANDLDLNLYRIDLSAVVSKYIGETEKNLRTLFDAAEQGGAILFFDEADALFGKRSEVKDSHDRYANIEVSYLLQRIESFSGLSILATNMKSALDPAFLRRLRFIVKFQFPGSNERKQIWQKSFPEQVPLETLDYDRLAKINITGGNIHSIALNAAFLAAQARKPVSMALILEAARTELRKLDKPVNEAEFRMVEVVSCKS